MRALAPLTLALCLMLAGPAVAECRLALALALDVSSSVDEDEYRLQQFGLAAALDAPEVRHAILQGGTGHVMLAIYEWSGFHHQTLHLDWIALRTERDIDHAVLAIGAMTRSQSGFPTAVGHALVFGAALLDRAPVCTRQVIDVSGDGINNYGFGPATAYRNHSFGAITVNGLVILENYDGVADYYRRNVLRGPQSFLIVANGFEDFHQAMRRKLFREINDLVLGGLGRAGPRG